MQRAQATMRFIAQPLVANLAYNTQSKLRRIHVHRKVNRQRGVVPCRALLDPDTVQASVELGVQVAGSGMLTLLTDGSEVAQAVMEEVSSGSQSLQAAADLGAALSDTGVFEMAETSVSTVSMEAEYRQPRPEQLQYMADSAAAAAELGDRLSESLYGKLQLRLSDNNVEDSVAMFQILQEVAAEILAKQSQEDVATKAAEAVGSLSPNMLWLRYLDALSANPIPTKMATAFFLYSMSDSSTQILIQKKDITDMDADRVLRFATFGLVDGFMGHTWYKNLDIAVEKVLGEDSFVTIASKVAADQLVYCPFWYLIFFSVLGIMEGKSREAIMNRVVNDIPNLVVTNWTVWIPVMIVSFTFVPVDLRVLWTLSVMVCYTAFLSCFTNENDADLSVFDLQATLRGKKMDYASLQARERAAQVLVQAMSLSLFKSKTKIKGKDYRVGVHRQDVAEPQISISTNAESGKTRIFLHCTDREGLFKLVANAVTAQGLKVTSWQVDTMNNFARQVGEVVNMDGSPVTDRAVLESLEKTLQMVAGMGRVGEHPEKTVKKLNDERERWRHELVESREVMREVEEKVRAMPGWEVSDRAKEVTKKSKKKCKKTKIVVEPRPETDSVVVKLEVQDTPGMLPALLEEITDNDWVVTDATVTSDGVTSQNVFNLTPSKEAEAPNLFATVDDAALDLSADLLQMIEGSSEIDVVVKEKKIRDKREEDKRIKERSRDSMDQYSTKGGAKENDNQAAGDAVMS